MKLPLRRQFGRQVKFLTSATLALASLPAHSEQRIKPGMPLYVETKVKKGYEARVRVKDSESGKNASLLLSPLDKNSERAYGYFNLHFDDKEPDLELLNFYINNHKLNVFLPGPNSENVYKVYLFSSPNEKERFAAKFSDAAQDMAFPEKNVSTNIPTNKVPTRSIPTKSLPAKKIQEPKLTEVPKELPKVQALQAKSVEIQKKENEAKLNIEAAEAQKRAERLEQLANMKEQEKINRKNQAAKLGDRALQHYQKAEYKEAAVLFAEAADLDPESDTYYFQYGVSLYKTNDYKKSLALLSIAEGQNTNRTELTYFKALNHMKLKEYDQALEEFTAVKEENDENLSAPASFYAGNISFRKENYTDAREHLEYTLDHSKDPKVDQQAEDLIEEIDRIEAFQSKAKEQFRYSLTAGFGYDSNVLNTALQNLATNAEALRFNYGGSFLYRFFYDYRNEFSADLNLNDTYSMTPSFQPDSTLQSADPLVLSLGLPYRHQSLLGKRVINWGVTPQYQTITMSLDGQSRKQILASTSGKFDANFMLYSEWMSSYRFEYSADTSGITSATTDDDLSGTRMVLGTTQTKLLNQRGTNTWNYSLDYTMNQTQGKNYLYNKLGLGIGYTDKIFTDYDGTLKFDYSYQNYPQASTNRTDNLASLSATLTKEYWSSIYLSYTGQFNSNSSDVSSYRYDKFLFNISVTYMGSHKRK